MGGGRGMLASRVRKLGVEMILVAASPVYRTCVHLSFSQFWPDPPSREAQGALNPLHNTSKP